MCIHDKTNIKLSENQNLEIPSILFNFSNISELVNFEDNTIIDVIGIINSAAECRTITTKTGGIKKVKEFIIVDNSIFNTDIQTKENNSVTAIEVCVWEENQFSIEFKIGSVIAIKRAKLRLFKGAYHIACSPDSEFYFNDDLKEIKDCSILSQWYLKQSPFESITNITKIKYVESLPKYNFALLIDETTEIYYFRANVIQILTSESSIYPACHSCK